MGNGEIKYSIGDEVEFVETIFTEGAYQILVYAEEGDFGVVKDTNPFIVHNITKDIEVIFHPEDVRPRETGEVFRTTAGGFLDAARKHMEERAKTYDSPEGERSMGKAVTAFNAVTGHTLKESEGWLLLQLLKDTRQWSREDYHADSAEDCIAFAALKAESLARGE